MGLGHIPCFFDPSTDFIFRNKFELTLFSPSFPGIVMLLLT